MIALLGDENFNANITEGLRRRIPEVDVVQAHMLGIRGLPDPDLLAHAAALSRVVLTHDRRTMIACAYALIAAGSSFSGLIFVPDWLPVGDAIADLELLVMVGDEDELCRSVTFLPLGA